MSKLLTIMMAGTAALTLGACANPWWDRNDNEQPSTSTESQPGYQGQGGDDSMQGSGQTGQSGTSTDSSTQAGQDPAAGGHPGQRDEEFAEAVRKCQSMQGTAYQECVDKARQDSGQM